MRRCSSWRNPLGNSVLPPPPRPATRPAPIVEQGVDYASQAAWLRREAEKTPGAQGAYLAEMASRFEELDALQQGKADKP
jgi:hypothetical protein